MPQLATVLPKANFDAESGAKSFHQAFKGIGTDEKRVNRELAEHSNEQRQLIKKKYLSMYGKTLEEEFKSELNGNYEKVAISLLYPRFEYEASCVRKAIHGVGTDEKILIDLILTKESDELNLLRSAYKSLYQNDLENDLAHEERGDFGRLIKGIISAERPLTKEINNDLAKKEAQELYDSGVGKMGTDESTFIRILSSRSFSQLKATFDSYHQIAESDIIHSVKKETSGNFEEALITIIESARNLPAYFARRLRESCEGAGTNEEAFIRIVVTRSEIDLGDIKREYKKLYNEELYERFKSELSGDFEDIMLRLIGKN